jgi:hypothetical protein
MECQECILASWLWKRQEETTPYDGSCVCDRSIVFEWECSPARCLIHVAVQHPSSCDKRSNAVGHGRDSVLVNLSSACRCLVAAPGRHQLICSHMT